MSDVLKAAEMYRSKLQSEIAKINQFLKFAQELSKMGEPEAIRVPIDVATHRHGFERTARGPPNRHIG